MEPASPTKFPMSPGMPLFPVSPERAAGTKPPYSGQPPTSPSLPDLRHSPLRNHHRRNDSEVSVNAMRVMFENMKVKDPNEAQQNYLNSLNEQKQRHQKELQDVAEDLNKKYKDKVNELRDKLQKQQADALGRYEMRFEELKNDARRAKAEAANGIEREQWDKMRQEHRETIAKWEKAMQYSEEKRKQAEKKAHEYHAANNETKSKNQQYKKKLMEVTKESMRTSGAIPNLQTKIQSLEKNARRLESDLKFSQEEANKYKNQVYGLQVDLESVEARLDEEMKTLRDTLKLVEGERDALKTSLKEDEVLRIAADGQIPLPPPTMIDEHDEFGSPVRSPRKQRSPERDEDDKENVAPKKAAVEIKFLQQALTLERRIRTSAQEQVDFMKMECQFKICSCRIADLKGSHYVHDDTYAMEMERIKLSVPELTPPPSSHGEDPMEGILVKQEPAVESSRCYTPPAETDQLTDEAAEVDGEAMDLAPASPALDAPVVFSPASGTFRAVSATSVNQTLDILPAITELTMGASPWASDVDTTVIRHENVSPPQLQPAFEPEAIKELAPHSESREKSQNIAIYEDAVTDSDVEDDESETPFHGPSGPTTPAPFLTRTITTTTTIPLHFSPMTPAVKGASNPLTPSTIAHLPTGTQSQVLGEISLNSVPIDREAALAAIRERRGRARSMAAGNGTPAKQMMEGVRERRDISAPVARVRR